MECEYCKTIVKSKYNLKSHLLKNKTCLKLRGLDMISNFLCKGCQLSFTTNFNLTIHHYSCKYYQCLLIREECDKTIKDLNDKYNKEIEHRDKTIKDLNEILLSTLENKEHKLKIQYLTKKYVKAQPRIQYNEKNVIYILTTPSHKKEGKYILGKAANLTSRLSTYNKTDEHEVVYYQECPDEDSMSIIEQLIFHKLKDYREQANRERFILPEGKSIELFIDVIKKSINNL